jgi:uncharacterized protein YqgC (DUF456 family)
VSRQASFGIPGVFLGPFFGAVIGELSTRSDLRTAGRAKVGATLGLTLGTAVKPAPAFAMPGIFLVMRFFNFYQVEIFSLKFMAPISCLTPPSLK